MRDPKTTKIPPACYRSLSGPSGPKCPRSVPESVPENGGVSEGVSDGVSKKCPPSVPECQKGVPDTPGTLSGHFLDTPEPGARRAPETPCRTLPRTPPVFGDTLGTLRAQRARETPVAGRRDRNPKPPKYRVFLNL